MKKRREMLTAFAAVAAVSGTGFSSGREVVLFFAQMGWASWIGVVFAALMFGTFCGIICHFASDTGARSFPGVYLRVLGLQQGMVVGLLYGLLLSMTVVVMLGAAGELAALALPMQNAWLMGVLLAASAAMFLNIGGMRALPTIGSIALVVCSVFYLMMALDARPVSILTSYETELELNGSVTAALLFAMLHAAMNASLAAGVVARFTEWVYNARKFGISCGALMLVMLSASNLAMQRGGERLFSQALPTVLLAARWGKVGYYFCIVTMALCVVTTLTAALGGLIGQAEDGAKMRRTLILMILGGVVAAVALGIGRFIELAYPMLGWVCAFAMAALACYYDRRTRRACRAIPQQDAR